MIRRTDSNAKSGEYIVNQQGYKGHGVRHFYCPSGNVLPRCGWYGHRNRNYNPDDLPSNTLEIGSNNMYYKIGGHMYQSAACTWSAQSIESHATCSWSRSFPNYNHSNCGPGKSKLFRSHTGSGSAFCARGQNRKYCCRDRGAWEDCDWYDNIGEVPSSLRYGSYLGGCPDNIVPLGLDHYSSNYYVRGARARYYRPGYKTIEKELGRGDLEFNGNL